MQPLVRILKYKNPFAPSGSRPNHLPFQTGSPVNLGVNLQRTLGSELEGVLSKSIVLTLRFWPFKLVGMMGVHQFQKDLFSYSVQRDRRLRPDHPLRQVAALVDFSFVRAETARFYGQNGNMSVDPAVILKLNDRMRSQTDPDAAIVRQGPDWARPRYHRHRAVDGAQGVITAVKTTPGSISRAESTGNPHQSAPGQRQ